MRSTALKWFVAVAITASLIGAAARIFSESPKGRLMTPDTPRASAAPTPPVMTPTRAIAASSSESHAPATHTQDVTNEPRACLPTQQAAPQGSWRADGEPAVTFCPLW